MSKACARECLSAFEWGVERPAGDGSVPAMMQHMTDTLYKGRVQGEGT